MERKRIRIGICYLIGSIYILFTGSLMVMAVFIHCQTNIFDYEHTKMIERHMPFLYCAVAAFSIGAAAVWCALPKWILRQKDMYERMSRILFWLCGAVILAASVFWIFFNDSMPVNDQWNVFAEAQRLAGFRDEPFDTGYFSYFPRNRGITLLIAVIIRVLGNHLYTARLVNLLAVMLLYYSVCKASGLIWKNPIIASFTSILLMLFCPLVIYTSYLYGTLLSAALCSSGMYAALQFSEKGGRRYGLWIVCAFSVGILAHQSAAVGLVATLLYLMISGGKRNLGKNLLLTVMTAVMVFVSISAVDLIYNQITGADPNADAVPASCTIYMGITSTEGGAGPGSQDGSYTEIFNENDRDGKAANRDALQRIGTVAREYLSGEREFSFFLEKIQYQWLDPTFGARKTIVMNDPNWEGAPNSNAFLAFYNSSLRKVVFKLMVSFMLLVYFGAVVGGIGGIREMHNNRNRQAQMLIWLYVIGGGAFQVIWESFSRYCLNYFIWLIPGAAYGIYLCCQFFRKIHK